MYIIPDPCPCSGKEPKIDITPCAVPTDPKLTFYKAVVRCEICYREISARGVTHKKAGNLAILNWNSLVSVINLVEGAKHGN